MTSPMLDNERRFSRLRCVTLGPGRPAFATTSVNHIEFRNTVNDGNTIDLRCGYFSPSLDAGLLGGTLVSRARSLSISSSVGAARRKRHAGSTAARHRHLSNQRRATVVGIVAVGRAVDSSGVSVGEVVLRWSLTVQILRPTSIPCRSHPRKPPLTRWDRTRRRTRAPMVPEASARAYTSLRPRA